MTSDRSFFQSGLEAMSSYGLGLILLAVAVPAWLLYSYAIYPRVFSPLRHVPLATSYIPLVGHGALQFYPNRGPVFQALSKTVPKNNGLVRFRGFWDQECLLVTNARAITDMLVHHPNDFAKPERAKWVFGRFFGNSMIFAEDGSRYKNIKSAIQSAFTDRAIQTWYHLFWQKALDMVGAMKQQAHRDTNGDLVIEVHELSRRYTMSGMLQSIFGRTIDTSDQMVTLPPLLETILRPAWDIMLYFMFVAAFPLWTLKLIPGGTEARIDRAGQRLRDTVKELIEIRRNSAGDDQHDMLMQLSKNGRLNDDELVSNLLGLSLPGMETSSGSFSWTAMHLARNPEWQSRLREELRAWATDKSGLVDLETLVNPQAPETLDRLAVLDAVCNESLRMSPPSPVNIRVAARDCIIADQLVPAGTKVILCNYMYNRSEEYWGKTANEWDPNHWLSREPSTSRTGTATSTHAAFMVFSHGPRRCTGIKYAHAILRAFVAVFVLSFQFELEDPNQAIVAGGSLASIPNPGVTLRLRALTKKT